jgi:hypothetical protein
MVAHHNEQRVLVKPRALCLQRANDVFENRVHLQKEEILGQRGVEGLAALKVLQLDSTSVSVACSDVKLRESAALVIANSSRSAKRTYTLF